MKAIISLFIGAVVLASLVLYLLIVPNSNQNPPTDFYKETEPDSTNQPADALPEIRRGEGSLQVLASFEQPVECRISYDDPELLEPVIGTYFVSDGRTRGDFQLNVPDLGGEIVSSVIANDTMFYSWSRIGGESYGVKAPRAATDTILPDGLNEPVPSDVAVSYECEVWSPIDASVFEPPTDVLFRDALSVQESGMEYGTIYEEGEF